MCRAVPGEGRKVSCAGERSVPATTSGPGVEQRGRFGERDGLGRLVLRQRGINTVVADIRSVAAVLCDDRAALVRMVAQRTPGVATEAAKTRWFSPLFGEQGHRTIEADVKDIVALFETGAGLTVLYVRSEAANAGTDGFAILRVAADVPRQREQRERAIEVDFLDDGAFRQTGTLGLFTFARLAKLDVRTETTTAQRNLEAGIGICAKLLGADVA